MEIRSSKAAALTCIRRSRRRTSRSARTGLWPCERGDAQPGNKSLGFGPVVEPQREHPFCSHRRRTSRIAAWSMGFASDRCPLDLESLFHLLRRRDCSISRSTDHWTFAEIKSCEMVLVLPSSIRPSEGGGYAAGIGPVLHTSKNLNDPPMGDQAVIKSMNVR